MSKNWAAVFVSIVILVALGGFWARQQFFPPLIFSDRFMLESLWNSYKKQYIEPGTGRTIDRQRGDITTSEGQAYTMLRAVWESDKPAFDQSWTWTKNILQRPDGLFSWLFGRHPNGSFGVLTEQSGGNTASDADTDIALALVFAYARWQNLSYLQEAHRIIPQIWETEVVLINGQPYLAANNVEKTATGPTVLVNPSYFAPYAYRIFATIDRTHPWNQLASNSYAVIEASMRAPLDKPASAGLPPDWLTVERQTGRLGRSADPTLTTNYGFDAMRVPWRLALDARWYNEPRAAAILGKFSFLAREWQSKGLISATYSHDGQVLLPSEAPAMYGTALEYFLYTDQTAARKIYERKLLPLYNPDIADWQTPLGYYDDNLAWFGLAFYNQALPNLHEINLEELR